MLRLSVVVCGRDRSPDLQACLGGLANQSRIENGFEIILVSRAGESTIDSLPLSSLPHLRVIRCLDGDLGASWNRGAETAQGDVLLFIRDDFTPTPALVAAHRALHAERSDVIALGKVGTAASRIDLGTFLEEERRHAIGDPTSSAGISLLQCAGHTLSMLRATFLRMGPFRTGLAWGTEVEMASRVVRNGGILLPLPLIVGQLQRPASDGEMVAASREAGSSSWELYRHTPALLPQLNLGAFQRGRAGGLRLRRFLLAIGGPPVPVKLCRWLLPEHVWTRRGRKFLLSYYYWRGVRQAVKDRFTWQSITRAPLILMYHAVAGSHEPAGRFLVPLRRFKFQMWWLKFARYRVLGLEDLLDDRREHRLPPGRSVVLTFDDGYADNRRLAFPVLREHGFRATFFVVTRCIGGKNVWDSSGELAGRPLLSWSEVSDLLEAGMQIGAHTQHHVAIPDLPADEAEREIAGSRTDLERELERPIRAFAYPYGLLDSSTPAAVARAGFDGACCTRSGPNQAVISSYLLRRMEVRGTESLLQFIRALQRGHAARRRKL